MKSSVSINCLFLAVGEGGFTGREGLGKRGEEEGRREGDYESA